MKNFAALLATIASVHAIQLEAQAEAEAEFGLGEFFSAGEMVPQFLGSGFFPTEEVAGFIESGDEEEDVTVVPDEDAEEDDDEDAEEAAESEEKDPHGGANSAFASLANFDFDSLMVGDTELPIDLEDDNFEQAFNKHDLTASVPLVGDFGNTEKDPSLSAVLGSVTEAVKLYEGQDDSEGSDDDSAESEDEVESGDDSDDDAAKEE